MNKGDIVTLKEDATLYDALFSLGTEMATLDEIRRGNIVTPTELTVESTDRIAGCGCAVYYSVRFTEIPKANFNQYYFEVVLQAGEPDVNQLIQESVETKRMLIGF